MQANDKYEELVRNANRLSDAKLECQGIARGMRKNDGNGILVGLTTISNNYGRQNTIPCDGSITYRGKNLLGLIDYSYEDIVYLLLFGRLPSKKERISFGNKCVSYKKMLIPSIEEIVEKECGKNVMNVMARSVLSLYDYDTMPENNSLSNLIRQVIQVIIAIPIISINAYSKLDCLATGEKFHVMSDANLSSSESILYMLRNGKNYTPLEVYILNVCLILHAELGGGNNSTLTTHVVSSSGTDTYAVIASAISAIKGPKHGGANIKAFQMFQDIKKKVNNWEDEEQINRYLKKIIKCEEFDGSGLIYGVGHRVFTISDPRTIVLKKLAHQLAKEKGRIDEFNLYALVEMLAPAIIKKEKSVEKPICANVDFYSGFIYDMLGIPEELFTPMFVNARVAGWGAHRLEEMCNNARIIHPAYNYVERDEELIDFGKEKKEYGKTIINIG